MPRSHTRRSHWRTILLLTLRYPPIGQENSSPGATIQIAVFSLDDGG